MNGQLRRMLLAFVRAGGASLTAQLLAAFTQHLTATAIVRASRATTARAGVHFTCNAVRWQRYIKLDGSRIYNKI